MSQFRLKKLKSHKKHRRHSIELINICPGLLNGSVGASSDNKAADVLTVQKLLNVVIRNSHSRIPELACDGKIGPKTIDGINWYQKRAFRTSDGRIEADRYTIRSLLLDAKTAVSWRRNSDNNLYIRTSSKDGAISTPGDDLPDQVKMNDAERARTEKAFSALPTMLRLGNAALSVISQAQFAAREQLQGIRTGDQQRLSLALVHKHFSKKTEAQAELFPHIPTLITRFNAINAEVKRRSAAPEKNGFFIGLDALPGRDMSKFLAETTAGGLYGEGETQQKGCFLGKLLDTEPSMKPLPVFAAIVFHELFHWITHRADQLMNDDEQYPSGEQYAGLLTADRIKNADCYSNLAFDATFGTKALREFRIDLLNEHARRPFVEPNGFLKE